MFAQARYLRPRPRTPHKATIESPCASGRDGDGVMRRGGAGLSTSSFKSSVPSSCRGGHQIAIKMRLRPRSTDQRRLRVDEHCHVTRQSPDGRPLHRVGASPLIKTFDLFGNVRTHTKYIIFTRTYKHTHARTHARTNALALSHTRVYRPLPIHSFKVLLVHSLTLTLTLSP